MSRIFISYATGDQAVASEVCALLEAQGHACWIAPRDVVAGKVWDEAILDAIESASGFLLILSSAANASPFVKNEVNRAFSLGKPILTFRVEEVLPGRSLELYLARHHWTDGFKGRIEEGVAELSRSLAALGSSAAADPLTTAASSKKRFDPKPKLRTLSSRRERWAWSVAAALALGLIATSIAWLTAARQEDASHERTITSDIQPPEGTTLVPGADLGLALSPDGQQLVFAAKLASGSRQLFIREMSDATTRVVPETMGASFPFWSPDGLQIGFFAEGKLKVIDLRGGAPRTLADAPVGRGGDWNTNDQIIYSPDPWLGRLRVISAKGGEPRDVTMSKERYNHRYPAFLPDGVHFLFHTTDRRRLMLGSLDGSAPRELIAGSTNARFVSPGYILFGRGSDLFAWQFDERKLQLVGSPQPVPVGKTDFLALRAYFGFSVTSSGTLVYAPADYRSRRSELRLVGRDGRLLKIVGDADRQYYPRLSPDGKRIVSVAGGEFLGRSNLWITEVEDARRTQLSQAEEVFISPVWTPDSQAVIVGCSRTGRELCVKSLNDGTDFRVVYSTRAYAAPLSISADGRTLLFEENFVGTDVDLQTLDLSTPGKEAIRVVVKDPGPQSGVTSPDGRWLVFTSSFGSTRGLYVQPMSGSSRRWTVWNRSAYNPRWTKGGRELVFATEEGKVMSARVVNDSPFTTAEPEVLFELPERPEDALPIFEDVTADGERILLNVPQVPASKFGFRMVTNWPALLQQESTRQSAD
jgi:eukaryotic-like serine/threonine-protein kinase